MSDASKSDTGKRPSLELLDKARPVLDNPFLKLVIEAATTPKQADEHMCQIGWGKLAPAVREGVRLRQQYPQVWESIKQQAVSNPWAKLFGYALVVPSNEVFRRATKIYFGQQPMPDMQMDWPFFLCPLLLETATWKTDPNVGLWSCFHSADLGPPVFSHNTTLNSEIIWKSESHSRQVVKNILPDHVEALIDSGAWTFRRSSGGPRVMVKSVILQPGKRSIFPEWYQLVEVTDADPSVAYSSTGGSFDRVRVALRLDLGPDFSEGGKIEPGEVFFERVIAYPEARHVVEIKFCANYGICFGAQRVNYLRSLSGPQITVGIVHPDHRTRSTDVQLHRSQNADAVTELSDLANGFFCNKLNTPLLEQICGRTVFEQPPDRLADLFIKSAK